MTIGVKSHALVSRIGGRCTEVRRGFIITPRVTLLVTTGRVTGNEEAGVERMIADQQLIGVTVVCSHAVPQSISTTSISIIRSGRYRRLGLPFEGHFLSSLAINEHYF